MTEEWREIPEWPLYEVSSDGRVRSWKMWGSVTRKLDKPRYLKPSKDKDGYLFVRLVDGGPRRNRRVHGLVLRAFVGPPPSGHVGCHGNAVRDDNRLSNLRWGTPQDNADDRAKHGNNRGLIGELSGTSKLTWTAVAEIRAARKDGAHLAELAAEYGVSEAAISMAARGITWRDAA